MPLDAGRHGGADGVAGAPLVDALARHVMAGCRLHADDDLPVGAGDVPHHRRALRLDIGAGGALPERADPEVNTKRRVMRRHRLS